MVAAAWQAEVAAYIDSHADQVDEAGRRLVGRNGSARAREVLISSGAVEVVAARVNDRRVDEASGERRRFASAILPPWCRKSPKINEVLPLLYLQRPLQPGLRAGVGAVLGTSARGRGCPPRRSRGRPWRGRTRRRPSPAVTCPASTTSMPGRTGVHLNVRLDEVRLCLLVLIGVRADGTKELVTLADGFRESSGSWADLLRDAARRGMRAPVLAVGDGALGFWSALGEVFEETRAQRCRFHKIANVLAALPKSAHPGAKRAWSEIYNAEDREHARAAVTAFAALYAVKFPKAVAKVTEDVDELLAFYDYPAEHWIHLRTTNPIE